MGAQMERDMRKELFDQYQRLSFSYYDKHNTGIMMSRVVSDLFDICEFAHHGPENLFISLIKIVGSFVILSLIYWPLALLLFIVTLIMLIFSYTQNKSMRATFMDNRRKIGDVKMPPYRIACLEFVSYNLLPTKILNVRSFLIPTMSF